MVYELVKFTFDIFDARKVPATTEEAIQEIYDKLDELNLKESIEFIEQVRFSQLMHDDANAFYMEGNTLCCPRRWTDKGWEIYQERELVQQVAESELFNNAGIDITKEYDKFCSKHRHGGCQCTVSCTMRTFLVTST